MAYTVTIRDGRNKLAAGDADRQLLLSGFAENIVQVQFDDIHGSETLDVNVVKDGDDYICDIPNQLLTGKYSELIGYVVAADAKGSYTVTKARFEITVRQTSGGYVVDPMRLETWAEILAQATACKDAARTSAEEAQAAEEHCEEISAAVDEKAEEVEANRDKVASDKSAVATLKTDIESIITQGKTDIGSAKSDALSSIETAKTKAVSAVSSQGDASKSAVQAQETSSKAVLAAYETSCKGYSESAASSKTVAEAAKTAAETAEDNCETIQEHIEDLVYLVADNAIYKRTLSLRGGRMYSKIAKVSA